MVRTIVLILGVVLRLSEDDWKIARETSFARSRPRRDFRLHDQRQSTVLEQGCYTLP